MTKRFLLWGLLFATHAGVHLCSASENEGPFIAGTLKNKVISSDPGLSEIVSHNLGIGVFHNEYRLIDRGASYISVKFTSFDFEEGCQMVIDDKQFNHVHSMTGLGKQLLGTFWCHHVEDDELILTVKCDDPQKRADFMIEEYVAGFPGLITGNITGIVRRGLNGVEEENQNQIEERRLGVCGSNDKADAKCYESSYPNVYHKSTPVARILVNGIGICTGFLVGPSNQLLTSGKCIKSAGEARNSDIQFMFESTACNGTDIPYTMMYEATDLLAHSIELDYALLQLDGKPVDTFGYLSLESTVPTPGEVIFIPQQPMGRDKEIAMFDTTNSTDSQQRCTILTNGQAVGDASCSGNSIFMDIGYSCDTEGGSLGAPVISESTGLVVGMHHCGNYGDTSCGGNYAIPAAAIYAEVESYFNQSNIISGAPSPVPQTTTASSVPSDLSSPAPSVPIVPSRSSIPSNIPSLVTTANPTIATEPPKKLNKISSIFEPKSSDGTVAPSQTLSFTSTASQNGSILLITCIIGAIAVLIIQ